MARFQHTLAEHWCEIQSSGKTCCQEALVTDTEMVNWQMVLGEAVCEICGARGAVDIELFLCHVVANPMAAHVDGARFLLFDGVGGNAAGCGVVDLCWCGGLRPT